MMHYPRYFFNQQKNFNYPEQMPTCTQYNNESFFPPQQGSVQQNRNFYQESSSCIDSRGIEEPLYDPKRRFSPPHLDTPPMGHRDMSFDGGTIMMDSGKFHDQPQSSFHQQHHPPQFNQCAPEKFDSRKVSVHANFYNYNMPFDERPSREQHLPTFNAWRKHSAQGIQINTPQRKFSHPAEMIVSPAAAYDSPISSFQRDKMLSPQPVKREVSFNDSPMEVEPLRKKSSAKDLQAPSRKSSAPRRHANIPTRKASQMATKSQLRTPRFGETTTKYTPPPILSPMRNGTGLFWQACKGLVVSASGQSAPAADMNHAQNDDDADMSDESPGLKIDEAPGPSEMTPPIFGASTFGVPSNGETTPFRKKGFFLMAAQMAQPNFADELEALRKESFASTSSHRSGEDVYRKLSNNFGRKDSTNSIEQMEEEQEDIVIPTYSDATPHINIGSPFQARVFKWKEREITDAERDAIEDKDNLIFSFDVLEGIDPKQVDAYELLACSQAVPNPGKNKELALHLLMENNGNIEASVADLLRCDTLDWEQYPIIHGTSYNDTTSWSPEEIASFQDAIYKSEKDFHQVAEEVTGSKSVKECIEFYYNWKKACPDDYRKLRNLRRKRQLLEINMQNMEEGIALKKCSLEETSMEQDIEVITQTHPAFQGLQDYLETQARPHAGSFSGLLTMASPLSADVAVTHANIRSISPKAEIAGLQRNYQPSVPRASITSSSKKGAQPSADGFFHCRLCDKCFEKVKSLNAHMKSHAMKARAEAEAKAQVDAQMAAQTAQLNQTPFPNGTLNLGNIPATLTGLTPGMSPNGQNNTQNLGLGQNLLTQQGLQNLPHYAIPLLQQHLNHTTQIIN